MFNDIAFLKTLVLLSIRRAAPEKTDALQKVVEDLGVKIIVHDDPAIRFDASPDKKHIRIGTPSLAFLWGHCYAYFMYYDTLMRDYKASGSRTSRELKLRGTERHSRASDLLVWTIETELLLRAAKYDSSIKVPTDWPANLPKPKEDCAKGSDEDVADKLFLYTTAFILHHELAHLRLGHRPPSELDSTAAILQEKEADQAASDWLLEGMDDEWDGEFVLRSLGVCMALVWLTSVYIYARPGESLTHPPAYDRLYQIISRHITDPNHHTWAFMQNILTIHIQSQNIPHEQNKVFGSFKEAADYFLDVISKLKKSN